jgi:hypothetical protein
MVPQVVDAVEVLQQQTHLWYNQVLVVLRVHTQVEVVVPQV